MRYALGVPNVLKRTKCAFSGSLTDSRQVPGIAATTGLGVHNARRAVPPPPPVDPVKPIDPTKPDDPNQKPISDPIKPPISDPTYSEKATCGADDGKVYITSDGENISRI
jgi:hypothetical protein